MILLMLGVVLRFSDASGRRAMICPWRWRSVSPAFRPFLERNSGGRMLENCSFGLQPCCWGPMMTDQWCLVICKWLLLILNDYHLWKLSHLESIVGWYLNDNHQYQWFSMLPIVISQWCQWWKLWTLFAASGMVFTTRVSNYSYMYSLPKNESKYRKWLCRNHIEAK